LSIATVVGLEIDNYRCTAPIKIRYLQFARILLYWMGITHLMGQLGSRSYG